MSLSCEIIFDNNNKGKYFAGEILSGKVVLENDRVKSVRGVILKITGFAHTKYKDSKNRCYGARDYIAGTTYLLGSEDCEAFDIEPGLHKHSFTCPIPENCPTSFEGTSGHIRYAVTVIIKRPWQFEQTFTKKFTVLKEMSLSYDSINLPVKSGVHKTFCCTNKHLEIDVIIPQGGYEIGQYIPVNVLITNESNAKVKKLDIALVMLVRYSSNNMTVIKNERKVVAQLNGEGAPSASTKNVTYELLIPEIQPSSFDLCRILKISYQLEVKVIMNSIYMNEVISLPLVIGKMPLKCALPMARRGVIAPRTTWNSHSYLPPPTYTEALLMK